MALLPGSASVCVDCLYFKVTEPSPLQEDFSGVPVRQKGNLSRTPPPGPGPCVTAQVNPRLKSTRHGCVYFFVLCNRLRFNRIPGPPLRDGGVFVFYYCRTYYNGTREEPGTLTQGAPVFPGSSRLGIEPKTPGWLVQDPTTRPIGDLIPTMGGSGAQLQGGWCKTVTRAIGDLIPTIGGSGARVCVECLIGKQKGLGFRV